jgi:RDD family
MDEPVRPAPVWKRVTAAMLDFLTAFFLFGWVIAEVTGQTTENGFNLQGAPAFVLFALLVAYFFIGRRYAGGTLWDRIFGIRRPQPN